MVLTEFNLRLPNSPGALTDICELLAAERVNILAMCLTDGGHLHLVVNNPTRASGVLRDLHYQVRERDVILTAVNHSPGGAASALRLLSQAGINLNYAYAAGAEGSPTGSLVLGVDNAQHAAAMTGL